MQKILEIGDSVDNLVTQSAPRNWRTAWIVLLVGLIITAAATLYMKASVERIAEQEFITLCKEIKNKITERLDDHARLLQSGVALFMASDMVSREEWHIFTQHQNVEKRLPGIQGIGFSLLIPREELTRHIQKIRREGFPEYNLSPDGDREVYSSIIYLEPFSGRNLRAFGYDMFSEPVRRAAMERARDTDAAALSGKVVLVQEAEKDVQAGTLMYVPVYRKVMPIETVEQRRAAIYGWVYSPYRMNDLMQGILGGHNLEQEKQLHLQVFDGDKPSTQSLLYSDTPSNLSPERFTRKIPVDFNGQRWTLRFGQTGGGFSTVPYIRVWLTMVGGILITFLLFAIISALLNTRAEAQRIAENMTEVLRESKGTIHLLLNSAAEGIYGIDMNGDCTFCNNSCLRLLGYNSPDELLGKNMHMQIHSKRPEGTPFPVEDCRIYQAFHNGEGTHVDDEVLWRSDDTSFPAEYWSYPLHRDGAIHGAVVTFFDITERRQAEEALQQAKARLSLATRAGGVGIWDYDTVNNVLAWDDEIFRLYGITKDQFGGAYEAWRAGLHPEDRAQGDAEIQMALQGEKEFDTEFRVVWPDGTIHSLRALALVQRDAAGQPLRMIGTNWDITPEKQMEEALAAEKQIVDVANVELAKHRDHLEYLVHERTRDLAESRDKAESANRAKSAFLANMSHELRTPLHHIMGFGQLLAPAVKDQRAEGFLVKMLSSSRQLLGLIDDILDYSKISAGEMKIESVDYSLSTLLDQSEKEPRKAAKEKGLQLAREVDPGLPALLKGDPRHIGQILDNLLGNAVKFSEWGRITLRVRKVQTDMRNMTLRFEVEDQGIGITHELQAGLFQLFNQGDNSLTRKYGGTGLGLALCKRLTVLMGGKIGVISTPSQGSNFWFSVPLPIGEAAATDTVEAEPVS